MAYQAIKWAKQSSSGDQDFSSGERLVNLYAVRGSPRGEDAKVPVILYGSPGLHPWATIRDYRVFTDSINTTWGGIWLLDSPIYGKRLQGIWGGNYFVDYRLDGSLPPQGAQFYIKGMSVNAKNIAHAQLQKFLTQVSRSQPKGYAARYAIGRNNVLFITQNNGLYRYGMDEDETENGIRAIQAPRASDDSSAFPDEEWIDCAWVDGYYFLLTRGGELFHSLYNEIQFEQLDFARVNIKPDEAIGMGTFMRKLYVFSKDSIEQWYNAGDADFAFRRNNSFSYEVGCLSKYTIQSMPQGILFLGDEGIVYWLTSGGINRVSTESVEADILPGQGQYARAYSYTEEGHRFYSLTLFNDGEPYKNWTFDNTTSMWHERDELNILSCAATEYGNIVCRGGDVEYGLYKQSIDFGYTMEAQADSPGSDTRYRFYDKEITRIARSPVIHANQRRVNMYSFQVDMHKPPGGLTIDRLCGDNKVVYFDGFGSETDINNFNSESKVWLSDFVVGGRGIIEARVSSFTSISNLNAFYFMRTNTDIKGLGLVHDQTGHVAWYPDLVQHPDFYLTFQYIWRDYPISFQLRVWMQNTTALVSSGNYHSFQAIMYLGADNVRYDTLAHATTSLTNPAAVDTSIIEQKMAFVFLDEDPASSDAEYHKHCATLAIKDQARDEEQVIAHKTIEEPRLKWNRLGQFRDGRNLKLTIASKEKIRIMGAYVETDVQDE